MINHIRNLLMNVAGNLSVDPLFPGEEIIDPAFTSVRLTSGLQSLRNILFGINPDRAMLNYRLRQYLTLIHSTELDSLVAGVDPRITYWPLPDVSLFRAAGLGATAQLTTATPNNFTFIGSPSQLIDHSRLLQQWRIVVTDGSNVTIQKLTEPTSITVTAYTIVDNLSNVIQLPGSMLSFRFQAGIGSTWFVQTFSRPTLDLPDILLALDSFDPINTINLFKNSTIDPYKTLSNLWLNHLELPYRLGAVVLALAFRTNEL